MFGGINHFIDLKTDRFAFQQQLLIINRPNETNWT